MAASPSSLAAMLTGAGGPPPGAGGPPMDPSQMGGPPPGAPMDPSMGGMGAPAPQGIPGMPSTDPQSLTQMLMGVLQQADGADQQQLSAVQAQAAQQAMPMVSQLAAQLTAAMGAQGMPPAVGGTGMGGGAPLDPMASMSAPH